MALVVLLPSPVTCAEPMTSPLLVKVSLAVSWLFLHAKETSIEFTSLSKSTTIFSPKPSSLVSPLDFSTLVPLILVSTPNPSWLVPLITDSSALFPSLLMAVIVTPLEPSTAELELIVCAFAVAVIVTSTGVSVSNTLAVAVSSPSISIGLKLPSVEVIFAVSSLESL